MTRMYECEYECNGDARGVADNGMPIRGCISGSGEGEIATALSNWGIKLLLQAKCSNCTILNLLQAPRALHLTFTYFFYLFLIKRKRKILLYNFISAFSALQTKAETSFHFAVITQEDDRLMQASLPIKKEREREREWERRDSCKWLPFPELRETGYFVI